MSPEPQEESTRLTSFHHDAGDPISNSREIQDDETICEDQSEQTPGLGKEELVKRYHALLRANAIYYPVAYQFLEELGRGRQGVVFLGLRQGARGCVTRHAIKVFDPGIYKSTETYWTDMGRIASQISSLQTMRTPHLVSREVYEESDGIGYVQMELIRGISLDRLANSGILEQAESHSSSDEWSRITDIIFRLDKNHTAIQPGVVIHIMRHILRALEVLHEHGFAHADIKPANVMLDQMGNVKVIDYGRAVRLEEKLTILLGTPHYMAPELHQRSPNRAQSDLYSVGILGIELLTGRRLFTAHQEKNLIEEKLSLPARLSDILPDYVRKSGSFMRTLRSLINPDPANRCSSAREAESGNTGLAHLNRELVHMNADADYSRELEMFVSKLVHLGAKPFAM